MGFNGVGKLIFVSVVIGLFVLDCGWVCIGWQFVDVGDGCIVLFGCCGVGLFIQDVFIFEYMLVFDNVVYGLCCYGLS